MKKIAYLFSLFALPLVSFAAATDITSLGQQLLDIANTVIIPLIFALAFIVFIWGVFKYFIMGGSDEEARDSGKNLMIWGIIGFFVMVSVWGLVNIVVNTFGLNTNSHPDYPQLYLQ